jgi:hypothetical protein
MRGDMAPVESPVDDGDRDADGHTGEGNRLASGNLDGLLGWGHHLGRHATKLVAAIRTVALLITVEAGRDALVGGDASKLRGPAHFLRVLCRAVGLICVVLAVKVTITTPQLEGTVPISTGELIGLAGLGGPAVQLITTISAVLLPVTEVVFGDAVAAVACNLLVATRQGPVWTGEQRLGSRRVWRWLFCSWLWPNW